MNHLFVTQDYAPDLGGMARRHVELCRRAAPDTLAVSTVSLPPGATPVWDAAERYAIDRQPFTFAQAKRFANQVRWGAWIAAACRRGVDIIHCGNLRPCGYAVRMAAARTGVPYLVYVYGGDLLRELRKTRESALKRYSALSILSNASGVVAISTWTAGVAGELIARLGIRQSIPVASIDLGTDPVHFSPSRNTGGLRRRLGLGDEPLLLTVARLVPHKGQDVALRVMHALRDKWPALRYLVVGNGHDETRLRALATELGVADRVIFAGALSDDEVAEAYATATVYIGLSRVDEEINVEGFGLSFVEAAASGVPSVAGDSGGVRSAVRDGETAFVVPPLDEGAAAAAVHRLLANDDLRLAMGSAARRSAETHYNWDRVARETFAFARDVTAPAMRRKGRGT